MPEAVFGRSGLVAEVACEVSLILVTIHGVRLPSPEPSPQGGGNQTKKY
jgi:hypothetical protein